MANCNESFSRLSFNDGSLASTRRLSAGDVRNIERGEPSQVTIDYVVF